MPTKTYYHKIFKNRVLHFALPICVHLVFRKNEIHFFSNTIKFYTPFVFQCVKLFLG